MSNIFEIQNELLAIEQELEENGGELTEELEQKLIITQETFKEKVRNYTNVIKMLENDTNLIKEEQARLKELCDRKNKTIDKLKSIIVTAIEQFGETKKSGTRYLNYGTGEISVRTTKAVVVDEELLEGINKFISEGQPWSVTFEAYLNELGLTPDDVKNINVTVTAKVPLNQIYTDNNCRFISSAFNIDSHSVETTASKKNIKDDIEAGVASHIGVIKENKNICIK